MQARSEREINELDQFVEMISSPEQDRVLIECSKLRDTIPGFVATHSAKATQKYLMLLLILNSGNLLPLMNRLREPVLLEFHLPLLFSNMLIAMQKGFEIMQNEGNATLESDLLPLCAINSNVENFNAMCERLGLVVGGEAYASAMLRNNEKLLLPIAPLFIAAYSGNLNLLRGMCDSLGKEKMSSLEEQSGLSVLHYAAMGGDVDTINYLCDVLALPFSQKSTMGISAFAYTSLSNNPDAVATFMNRGYKPTEEDKSHFVALFNNDISTLRKLHERDDMLAYDMPYVLKEAMGDPEVVALKAARSAIVDQFNATSEMMDDLIRAMRRGGADLEMSRILFDEAANAIRSELFSYIHLSSVNARFAKYIDDILEKVDEQVAYFNQLAVKRQPVSHPSLLHSRSLQSQAPQPSSSPAFSSPSLSSTSKMLLSDVDWQRRIDENIARHAVKEEEFLEDDPYMLDLEFDYLDLADENEFDFGSDVEEKEEKSEKDSPRPSSR